MTWSYSILLLFVAVCSVSGFNRIINVELSTVGRQTLAPISNNGRQFTVEKTKTFELHMMAADSAPAKKIMVLGGDGFCGWPTSLHLSEKGHEVIVIDNLSRRKIDIDLGCDSLTPIAAAEERVRVWNAISGMYRLIFIRCFIGINCIYVLYVRQQNALQIS